ncbi:hypothetical protein SD70_23275 [Gordoniibacillus kamchatkensis]|uniref:HTH araC/xylS-type domain-containing protein n=1 Tax=Gordoniibacillus kamchatkensis TaxID=1590651 RepID=A0ABR5AD32_9BACL|nr:AraC family transcriptional regulator [Paenibacillus sp. VKM B-2647]KIL38966.1 hypothetical protein SD70_23275 [Paenibacillus sp. VKM B-2647]
MTTKLLAEISPYVRMAHPWFYHNHPGESRRTGYSYAFHLFTEGRGRVMVDDTFYETEKGTLIFIRPGIPHSFHYRLEEPTRSINIYCDFWSRPDAYAPHLVYPPNPLERRLLTKVEECPELELLPTSSSLASLPYLQEFVIQIVKATEAKHYAEQAAGSLMYAFILRWYDSVAGPQPTDKRIVKIIEEMEHHPESWLGLERWCQKCGLEKSHFYHLFKQETGMTPKQYLLKVRMRKAAALLKENNQSITSVAEQLGYDSIHYFSRQFTDYYGISPSRFRSRSS